MDFIDLDTFLSLFNDKAPILPFNEWLNKAKIKFPGRTEPLSLYFDNGRLDNEKAQVLYGIILNKNKYLTTFYNRNLKINSPLKITEEPMIEYKNNTSPKYKNVIRNLFYKEILYNTQTGCRNVPTFLEVILALYNENTIDYKLLTPSGLGLILKGKFSSIVSGFYFRASIMNPYLVYSLDKNIFHSNRVFTPTLGWCSYLYGFGEAGASEYVGIDVIPRVCDVASNFSTKYYPKMKTNIYCRPSEDFLGDRDFIKKYVNHFDTIFFSPPYYKLELYKGGEQSTDRYGTYEEWLEEYWHNTIILCYILAKKGATLCYIISGYGKYTKMVDDMNDITSKYFHFDRKIILGNNNVSNTKHRDTGELINIFTKK